MRMSRYRVLMACAIPSISGSGRARVSSSVCGPQPIPMRENGCSSNNSASALNKGHQVLERLSAPGACNCARAAAIGLSTSWFNRDSTSAEFAPIVANNEREDCERMRFSSKS